MSRKCALIVDDSRSARVVLGRMLEDHDLDVATAESAEHALEYLSGHRPDVIFMDHLMPGMDGFEAVQAIKANPETATIPIMMYTSQEGELYVGQARALGAMGVLPKQVQPVEVSKVLESLRLIPGSAPGESFAEEERRGAGTAGNGAPPLSALDQNLRELIEDLFRQHRAVLRRDLLDSYEAIAARVAEEIREEEEEPPDEPAARAAPARLLPVVALGAIALGFAIAYWWAARGWSEERRVSESLGATLERQESMVADGTLAFDATLARYEQSIDTLYGEALGAIEWAVNQSGRYEWGEEPFDDDRRLQLEELLDRLAAMDFRGLVVLQSHVGDFCLVGSEAAGYELAPADLPIEGCDKLGFAREEALALAARQTVGFANFVDMVAADVDSALTIEIVPFGNLQPVAAYPPVTEGVEAGEWNRIAAANNRVSLALVRTGGT